MPRKKQKLPLITDKKKEKIELDNEQKEDMEFSPDDTNTDPDSHVHSGDNYPLDAPLQ